MNTALGVAAGGAVGAPVRYLIDSAVRHRGDGGRPWGTWLVNTSGSLILGLLTGAYMYHHLGPTPLAVAGTGFCGAYTTFSTFSFETIQLAVAGARRAAMINVVGSLSAGLLTAAAGIALMAAI